jgi:hypothetical protein
MAKSKNSVERVASDLQIDEHIGMQESGWKMQAVGLGFIFMLVVLGAIGVFGDGIASRRKVTKSEVEVEYQRFYRFEARMELTVKVNSDRGASISFPNAYLKNFEVASIRPEPQTSTFNKAHVQYRFQGKDAMIITFFLIPRTIGSCENTIQVNESTFLLNHFIFP